MLAFLFIIVITGLSILISVVIGTEDSWFEVYVGGIIGLVLSGIVLSVVNKRKRAKELEAEKDPKKSLYKKNGY